MPDAKTLDLIITAAALALFAGGYVAASRHAARPADPLKPRLIPWRPLIIACGFGALLAIIHLVNLFGIETGRR